MFIIMHQMKQEASKAGSKGPDIGKEWRRQIMKMKKIMAAVLAGAMAVSMCGCGDSKAAATTSAAAGSSTAAAASTAAASTAAGEGTSKAIEDGVLTVGTNAEFPPFEYVDDNGDPDGFDIALIKAIGEKMGVKVEVQNMEFDSLVSSIGNKIDVAIAGMTITDERKETVDFSDPYYEALQYVIVPSGSAIKSAADLSGKNIGTQLGTTGDLIVQDLASKDSTVTDSPYDTAALAVQDLLNGKIDCVIIDKNPAEVLSSQYTGKLSALDGKAFDFGAEDYAIAMPKGDTALQTQINKALADLKADGTFDALVKQYIEGSDSAAASDSTAASTSAAASTAAETTTAAK